MKTFRLEDRDSFITADGSSIREPAGATTEHFHRTSEEIHLFTRGMGRTRLRGDQGDVPADTVLTEEGS